MELQKISNDWNCPVVVAATGPSLTPAVAARVRRARWPEEKCRVIAVNDAYRLLPYADILYACDAGWWRIHIEDVRASFHGEKWTTHEGNKPDQVNYKGDFPADWGVRFVRGRDGQGFSADPRVLHYGSNSGFQAINLALLKGATRVILVGFDMRRVEGRAHFFGDHPDGLCNTADYGKFAQRFVPGPVPILNATPGSALTRYPMVDLEHELGNDRLLRHGPVDHARASAGGA